METNVRQKELKITNIRGRYGIGVEFPNYNQWEVLEEHEKYLTWS